MADKPLPGVQIFALADNAYQDANSRKWVLAGVFNQWNSVEAPFLAPGFSVYIRLTDVVSVLPWKLRLVWLRDSSTVMEISGETAPASNRLLPSDIHIRFPGLRIEDFGTYSFQFFVYDTEQYLKELRFLVTKLEPKHGADRHS